MLDRYLECDAILASNLPADILQSFSSPVDGRLTTYGALENAGQCTPPKIQKNGQRSGGEGESTSLLSDTHEDIGNEEKERRRLVVGTVLSFTEPDAYVRPSSRK